MWSCSKLTVRIMSPPPCQGGMRSSSVLAAVEHADARRAEHLVSREGIEIAAELLHVRPCMCGTACAPSMSVVMPRALAAAISLRTGRIVPRALDTWAKANRRVRGAHQSLDCLGVHLAARIHGRHHELRAGLLAQHLPGHDVRVMLEMGNEHLIARLEQGTSIALRDQIDGLGRAAHEHDLARRTGVDEARDALACALIQRRRFLAQRMHAAMDVGVMHAARIRPPPR